MELFCARQRRKFCRGIKRKPIALLKKLRKAKQTKQNNNENNNITTNITTENTETN